MNARPGILLCFTSLSLLLALGSQPAAARGIHRCVAPARAEIDVVFSPQPYEHSHLARVAALIDGARRSIDIALYGLRDPGVLGALRRAAARGVSIRAVLETARRERSEPTGTASAALEDAGIEVRWINKIMHHKFALIDGVRARWDEPRRGILVTGSGNWSWSAGMVYDESTLFIRCSAELVLRFQREFDLLWESSRPLVWNESIEHVESLPVTGDMIPDEPAVGALFTSANFRVRHIAPHGPTFSAIRGRRVVAARLVEMIRGAQRSILLASGHLRSRPVAHALMAKALSRPDLDIRVYLDGQEWISERYHRRQMQEQARCLEEAEDEEARDDCLHGGLHLAYAVHARGIPVRFKYYAYRWDYRYAAQMHHKLMIVDGRYLATGSYNLSDNAETHSMENVVIIDGARHREVVRAFEEEFERMWNTGEGLYAPLLAEIIFGSRPGAGPWSGPWGGPRSGQGSGPVRLVFEPMALTWDQVAVLREAIRAACPAVDTARFRENPAAHRLCFRPADTDEPSSSDPPASGASWDALPE